MVAGQQAHRAGALKQTNKSHKTGRHRSKGAIDNEVKGKANRIAISRRHKKLAGKDQRRNHAQQIRKQKREEVLSKKRSIGGTNNAPFLVTLLPLNTEIDPKSALIMLEKCDPEAIVSKTASGVTYITIPRFKQRFSFIIPPKGRGNELAALDYLKVSDTTVLLLSASIDEEQPLDKWGQKVLNMAIAQGIPTPIISLMDLESITPKRKTQAKQIIQKFVSKLFANEKIMNLDTNGDAFNLLRRIGGQKKNTLHNKANRPHMFGEKVEYLLDATTNMGILKVTGYLRGKPLDVNQLVHIPGMGEFQMSQIDSVKTGSDISEVNVLLRANPLQQVSLDRENIPDDMDAEQNFPTEEEIEMANEETKKIKLVKKVPKGMSDYQACWIPDIEEITENNDEDEDDDDDESDKEDFMSCDSNANSEDEGIGNNDDVEESDDEEYEDVTESSAPPPNEAIYDQDMDLIEERETLTKIKAARIDQLWPDEIDTPVDVPARERFQKFRGLESFRTSPWDVKENLPSDYARIYQFKNFDRTKRRIIKETENVDGAIPGSYIQIHIINVPVNLWNAYKSMFSENCLIIYGMLAHEQQMSVMNCVLKRAPDSKIPIKSKEKLIVQCGYRRFIVNPIYSQHTNLDKHKYERYFQPNTTVVATFYAPIQFPPAPILCFRENPDTSLSLVASGILLSCTPDRIILKRCVLSGHPLKINRKTATIRYMFFNKEDVEYFKPIKLRTKCGRLGHIKESLGTHGHMKCVFDGQLKSFDTVFLYLYKRVFPKWTYQDCIVTTKEEKSEENKNDVIME